MNNEQIIGLDISTTTVGVTVLNESGQLQKMTYIKPPKSSKKNGEVNIYDNGYTGDIDPSAGHTDPSVEDFFSPTDDLTILLLFS